MHAKFQLLKDIMSILSGPVWESPGVFICVTKAFANCVDFLKKITFNLFSPQISNGHVGTLPSNFFINNLISLVALHGDSQANKLECDNCVSGDPAVSRCNSCCQFLCKFCEDAHKRFRNTNSHKLMSIDEVKSAGTSAVVKPSMCREHEGESLKLFCESCDKVICRDCTIIEHRDHKYMFVKDAYAKQVGPLSDLLEATKPKVAILKKAVESVAEMYARVGINAEKAEKAVNDTFDNMMLEVEVRRKNLLSEINHAKNTKIKGLETQKEELEMALGSMKSSVEFTERALKDGTQVDVLQMKKQMTSCLKDLNATSWQLRPCAADNICFKAVEDQLHEAIFQFGCIYDVTSSAALSTVSMGEGDEGVMYDPLCNQPIEFKVVAKDYHDNKREEGGDVVTVVVHVPGQKDASAVDEVKDNGDGTYKFTYKPQVAGQYHMSVKLNGENVKGSPFVWNAEEWTLTQMKKIIGMSVVDGDMRVKVDANLFCWYNSITGTSGFSKGRHLWKVMVCATSGNVAVGIVQAELRQTGNFAWNQGNQWVLENGQKYQPSLGCAVKSMITSVERGVVLELLLDCDNGKLMIYNQRSGELDSLEGFKGEMFPLFNFKNSLRSESWTLLL